MTGPVHRRELGVFVCRRKARLEERWGQVGKFQAKMKKRVLYEGRNGFCEGKS